MLPIELTTRAASQHGLATRADLLASLSRDQIEHRTKVGALERVGPGVFRVAGAPHTWHQSLLAAVLAGGTGALASFRAAASLHGFEEFEPRLVELTTPRSRRARLRGAIVHHSLVAGPQHTAFVEAIPVTSVARTLCDLTAIRPQWVVERAVDHAIRVRSTTWRELEAVFAELRGRGRRRCTVMRSILDARVSGIEPGESPMEARLVRVLIGAGLPRPAQQHRLLVGSRTYRLDLAYPEARIAIEYDGWEAHRTRSAFDGDRARQNQLSLADWTILRFTSASSDHQIVNSVRSALDRVSPRRALSA